MQDNPWPCETNDPLSGADVDTLRAALETERGERRRAQCLASIQSGAVQLALDLLVREPDIDGFFGMFTKTLTEECESHACGVWLIDEDQQGAHLWMAYLQNQLFTRDNPDWEKLSLPRDSMASHLFSYTAGWSELVEYSGDDPRLPEPVRVFNRESDIHSVAVAPLVLATRTLGWVALSNGKTSMCEGEWRVALLEAIARQATLALHQSQQADRSRLEERRKAILEERNRLARDIHDTLAQGFAAILMQLQAAQRESEDVPAAVASKLETAVDLARSHMIEARRSVSALRPIMGEGEDLSVAFKRMTDMARRTSEVPIELELDDLPRYGDAIEREIVGIAQEALTNAVRHAKARQITVRAASVRSIGFRLSVADDGRGIARELRRGGFGMTSMQERANRIGASLTVVTAPRLGTEVVLAWQPSSVPAEGYVVA
jgi:signal transduction histidine kinase